MQSSSPRPCYRRRFFLLDFDVLESAPVLQYRVGVESWRTVGDRHCRVQDQGEGLGPPERPTGLRCALDPGGGLASGRAAVSRDRSCKGLSLSCPVRSVVVIGHRHFLHLSQHRAVRGPLQVWWVCQPFQVLPMIIELFFFFFGVWTSTQGNSKEKEHTHHEVQNC